MPPLFSFPHLNSIAFTFLPMVDCPSFLGFLHSEPCNFLFTLRVSASEESVLKALFIFLVLIHFSAKCLYALFPVDSDDSLKPDR